MTIGGYRVYLRGECITWIRPHEVAELCSTFQCVVDAVSRTVVLI